MFCAHFFLFMFLRCNLYPIEFSHLRCQWFLLYSVMQLSSRVNGRTFSSPHKEALSSLAIFLSFYSPWPLAITLSWTFHVNGIVEYVILWCLASFTGQNIFMVYPRCSTSLSFSRLNNLPLCGYTTFCLPTHQLMNTWVFSSFGVVSSLNNAAVNVTVQVL